MHQAYIQRCLTLAQKGLGFVSPNPMVGAVLIHQQRIIGEGYHEKFGEAHAEINCFQSVKHQDQSLIPDATLYVSLEPCCHFGKTPPCANAILAHGIKKVVIACSDPFAYVNGKGIEQLKAAGVEVITGILEPEAKLLNKRFFTLHEKKRPYIILKWAMSADGFIGKMNERTALSNNMVNKLTHQWRAQEDAIWVGYNTLKIDNPKLNVRHANGKNPIRLVYDKNNTLMKDAYFFDGTQPSLYYNNLENSSDNNLISIKLEEAHWLENILEDLVQRNVSSVIIEGGTKLIQQFIDKNLWDEARIIETSLRLENGVLAPQLKNNHIGEILTMADNKIIYKYP